VARHPSHTQPTQSWIDSSYPLLPILFVCLVGPVLFIRLGGGHCVLSSLLFSLPILLQFWWVGWPLWWTILKWIGRGKGKILNKMANIVNAREKTKGQKDVKKWRGILSPFGL
jgi:hypothetical protein